MIINWIKNLFTNNIQNKNNVYNQIELTHEVNIGCEVLKNKFKEYYLYLEEIPDGEGSCMLV